MPGKSNISRLPFTKSAKGCIAQPHGFFTTARWSVFCNGGRYSLTGRLMNRARSGGLNESR